MAETTRALAVVMLVLLIRPTGFASGQAALEACPEDSSTSIDASTGVPPVPPVCREAGDRARSDYRDFKRGVIAFRKENWAKAARMMERSLTDDERNTGVRVEVEDQMGAAPYLPGYYWGAAILASNPDPDATLATLHENCVAARGEWASILSDPCALAGLPVEAKKEIKCHLDRLEKRCSRIAAMQTQFSAAFPKTPDTLSPSIADGGPRNGEALGARASRPEP